MGYLALLVRSGSYVGLGIPLFLRGGFFRMAVSRVVSGTSSTNDWLVVSERDSASWIDSGPVSLTASSVSSAA